MDPHSQQHTVQLYIYYSQTVVVNVSRKCFPILLLLKVLLTFCRLFIHYSYTVAVNVLSTCCSWNFFTACNSCEVFQIAMLQLRILPWFRMFHQHSAVEIVICSCECWSCKSFSIWCSCEFFNIILNGGKWQLIKHSQLKHIGKHSQL